MIDARPFIAWIESEYEPSVRVSVEAGHYTRQPGETDLDLYGVADMACVLHTMGHRFLDPDQRAEWDAAFATFQDDDGWYVERVPTHHRLHSTAFAVAAMDLVGLNPRRPLRFAQPWTAPEAIQPFLTGLDWHTDVYGGSHQGAGLGALATLDPSIGDAAWFDAYFDALDRRLDPNTGMHGTDKPPTGDTDQIGGTFHYAFLYEWHHRSLAHPAQRINRILELQRDDGIWAADNPLWLTLDAIYLLTRSTARCGHRLDDIRIAVTNAADAVHRETMDPGRRDQAFGWHLGVHSLTAAVSILAEAQRFLGADHIRTPRPLRLVLDRRPFI